MSTPDNDMQSPGLNPYMEHVRTISGAFEDMLPLVLPQHLPLWRPWRVLRAPS